MGNDQQFQEQTRKKEIGYFFNSSLAPRQKQNNDL
jgi:hypothetical protein